MSSSDCLEARPLPQCRAVRVGSRFRVLASWSSSARALVAKNFLEQTMIEFAPDWIVGQMGEALQRLVFQFAEQPTRRFSPRLG